MKTRILILSFSPLQSDPRVNRQICFLDKKTFHISAAGYSKPLEKVDSYYPIPVPKQERLKQVVQAWRLHRRHFEKYYFSCPHVKVAKEVLSPHSFHAIICNDLDTLPLAVNLANGMIERPRIICDLHEHHPSIYDDNAVLRFFFQGLWEYVAKQYLPKADACTTVSPTIAQKYQTDYNVLCEVIYNAPEYHDIAPTEVSPSSDAIRMVHHGAAIPSRQVEQMISLVESLDERYSLDLYLVPTVEHYYEKLAKLLRKNERVTLKKPVGLCEIVPTLSRYDIGLFLLPPRKYSYRHALPNKFFEFLQARLALAIWPSPDMAKIVNTFQCGIVSQNFTIESMAKELSRLDHSSINEMKRNSSKAATLYRANQGKEVLGRIMNNFFGKK